MFTSQTVPHKERSIGENSFVLTHIKQEAFFGLATDWVGSQKIQLSDPHRTVIDFAYKIEDYGLNGFFDTLQAYLLSPHKNLKLLMDYTLQAGNRTLFKRLGFGLEKFAPMEEEAIAFCKAHISQGYSKICPSLYCPKVIRRWNLKVPSFLVER